MSDVVTPVRQQYLEIKKNHPDAILFFRLGDFYETFDEDAELISSELDIVLTSRNIAKGTRVPMAGIPHHAADSYLARLVDKGYHVAICEQIGDGPVKGLFPREVVRVITPGTVIEGELLPGDANNYIMSLIATDKHAGIAFADVSTGEFAAHQIDSNRPLHQLIQELERIQPVEVLLPESMDLNASWNGHQTAFPDWQFELARTTQALQDHFGVITLEGFGLADRPYAIQAAGALLNYLRQNQERVLRLLTTLSYYSLDSFMTLDAPTRRNLEISRTLRTGDVSGSLLGVLDRTKTPMGRRLIRAWLNHPLLDIDQINHRLDQVEGFYTDGLYRQELGSALRGFSDLERLAGRVSAGVIKPRELVAIRANLLAIPEFIKLVKENSYPEHLELIQQLDPCPEVLDLLQTAIVDDPPATTASIGVIREGFSKELDGLLQESRHAREWINDLEKVERERTGIKNLKVGFNKVFGYYIEVSKSNTGKVPEEYIRKQTLVNAERYITPEMKEYEAQVMSAEERIHEQELQIYEGICGRIGEQSDRLLNTARVIGRFDVLVSLGDVAASEGYTRPTLHDDLRLDIRAGRHPVVEQSITRLRFIPNDVRFESEERIRIITGPNMSGKSTYLRQAALIVLMAQMGSFVPAEVAEIGLTDRIFTRIGAQDEIHAGQSTFMVEMLETANILNNASNRSLLVLDEIGRGTSTYDGVSISWAVVEYLHNHPRLRARTLFATHYHELIGLAEVLPGVRNYNIVVSEEGGQVVFLHKVSPGGADKSYGIHVADLAGLPRPVINRAQEILMQFETGSPGKEPPVTQLTFLPDRNPILDELREIDISSMSPLEALNRLYEWQQRFLDESDGGDAE
jgi:DNA mismatch repair protein MutS